MKSTTQEVSHQKTDSHPGPRVSLGATGKRTIPYSDSETDCMLIRSHAHTHIRMYTFQRCTRLCVHFHIHKRVCILSISSVINIYALKNTYEARLLLKVHSYTHFWYMQLLNVHNKTCKAIRTRVNHLRSYVHVHSL